MLPPLVSDQLSKIPKCFKAKPYNIETSHRSVMMVLQCNLSLRRPLQYGHLCITDSSFGLRNVKYHTFPIPL